MKAAPIMKCLLKTRWPISIEITLHGLCTTAHNFQAPTVNLIWFYSPHDWTMELIFLPVECKFPAGRTDIKSMGLLKSI